MKFVTILAETMRSHYDRLDRIADDVARLGYEIAAESCARSSPKRPRAVPAILARSWQQNWSKRKSVFASRFAACATRTGVNMAMRGDDFIGAGYGG